MQIALQRVQLVSLTHLGATTLYAGAARVAGKGLRERAKPADLDLRVRRRPTRGPGGPSPAPTFQCPQMKTGRLGGPAPREPRPAPRPAACVGWAAGTPAWSAPAARPAPPRRRGSVQQGPPPAGGERGGRAATGRGARRFMLRGRLEAKKAP